MTSYTDVFGGSTVQAADVQFRAVALSASIVTVWPAFATTGNECARIMKVTPSAGSLTVTLPDATLTSAGMDVLFDNPGAYTFSVLDSAGGVIATVDAGAVKYFYLSDSSTAAGTWRVTLFGAGASSVDAGQLAGYGLKALTSTLNAAPPVSTFGSNYSVVAADRAKVLVWTGGSGTLTLPTTVGSTSDFAFEVRNQGTGTLTVATVGGVLIDSSASIALNVSESCFVHMGSADWYTVGRGRNTSFNFTQLSKVVAGGTVALTLSEASNVVQNYTGVLLSNQIVTLPAVVQVYYVRNNTTGAYTLTFACAAGGTSAVCPALQTLILFCDGTNIVNANTTLAGGITALLFAAGSLSTPSVALDTTNNGIYCPASNQIAISTGGVQGALFTSTAASVPGTFAASNVTGTNTGDNSANTWVTANFATLSSPAFTGTPTAPTATAGTTTTQIATTAFVTGAAFVTALPAQTGNSGKFVTTDGSNASWADGAYVPNLTSALIALPTGGAGALGLRSRVTIDANRELLFIGNTGNGMYAVCYDNSTKTFGTAVLVRATAISTTHASILVATDKVLLASCTNSSTAFEAVVITLSGTTVTVNTAVTSTLASACTAMSLDCCTAGSSYVFGMLMTTNHAVAITVSGTVPTIGTALNVTGNTVAPSIFAVDATRVLAIHPNAGASTIIATPLTVSAGTTLTAGTTASTTGVQCRYATALSTGRWALIYQNTTTHGAIVTVTGTVATISVVSLSAAGSLYDYVIKIGDQLLVVTSTTKVNVLTDASGTATAGTERTTGITLSATSGWAGFGTDYGALVAGAVSSSSYAVIKISGNSAYIYECAQTYAGAVACGFNASPSVPGNRRTAAYGLVSNGTKSSFIAQFANLATNTPTGLVFGATNGPTAAILPAIDTATANLHRQSDSVYWTCGSIVTGLAGQAFRINRVEMI
jgi:hypothetical protein